MQISPWLTQITIFGDEVNIHPLELREETLNICKNKACSGLCSDNRFSFTFNFKFTLKVPSTNLEC